MKFYNTDVTEKGGLIPPITIDGEESEISEDELEKYKLYNRLIMWLPASEMTSEEREEVLARQK